MTFVKLHHETDPRYLLFDGSAPPQIYMEEISGWEYGKPLLTELLPIEYTYVKNDEGVWIRQDGN